MPDVEKASAFKHVALIGEHPLFERLQKAAQKAGISLTSASNEATELCLLAPNATQDSLANYPVVALEEIGSDSDTALSLIIAENGQIGELVNVSAEPLTQQRAALTLKALRLNIVVSQQKSILRAMHAAIQQASASEKQSALEQASINIAEQSFCYRESDIDLLAVEAFGYPRHLGGPHRQATLSTAAKDV